jgi:hypothetical protein
MCQPEGGVFLHENGFEMCEDQCIIGIAATELEAVRRTHQ